VSWSRRTTAIPTRRVQRPPPKKRVALGVYGAIDKPKRRFVNGETAVRQHSEKRSQQRRTVKRSNSAVPRRDSTTTTLQNLPCRPATATTTTPEWVTRPADRTTTTLCICGHPFTPARKNQMYCSAKCRQKKYEMTAKARARRARYWKEGGACDAQRRYGKKIVKPSIWESEVNVLTLNKRNYRKRIYKYGRIAVRLWHTHGDGLTLQHVFGDGPEQVPWKAAYALMRRLKFLYGMNAFRKTIFSQRLSAYLFGSQE
jgi:hypothetical protein